MVERTSALETLRWYVDNGVDEAIGDAPTDRRAAIEAITQADLPKPMQPAPATPPSLSERAAVAATSSAGADEPVIAADSLEALHDALAGFDDCPLKHTASNLVFGAGDPQADVMLVGEAPGADEDRQGLPFVGVSGRLLDRMLESVGFARDDVYITNILPWRPPGNRKPTPAETTMCMPFIRRHIELVAPKILVLLGGTAAATLLGRREGITKLRGRWLVYKSNYGDIAAMPTFHPAFLLRSTSLKRDSWVDFLKVRERIDEILQ